jgi:hypothetical protein
MTEPGSDEQTVMPSTTAYRQRRPRAVWTASTLLIVFGLLAIFVTWLLLNLANANVAHGRSMPSAVYVMLFGQIALSSAQVVSGVFLWRGKEWALTTAKIICWLNLAGGILTLISGSTVQQVLGTLAINGGILATLNNSDVADWCDR